MTLQRTVLALLTVTQLVLAQFVRTNGVGFELNGSPFPFAGTNIYDAGHQTAQYAGDSISAVAAAGYRVLRTWAFQDYDTALGGPPGVYYQSWANGQPTVNTGANGLGLLDTLVSAAEAQNIKLILTLTNNWSDYGGMDVYVNNTLGPGQAHDLFYTDAQIGQHYQNYVRAVVSRYTNSPAILAWELANEGRCGGSSPANPQSSACNCSVVTAWANTMSAFIKSIDPNHLVSFGGEGFFNRGGTVYEYDGGSGQDYDALIALPTIDFGTMHLYISEATGYMNESWAQQFLLDHDASSVKAGKPCILEEYGVPRDGTTYNRQAIYDGWHQTELKSTSINGDLTWGSLQVDVSNCPSGDTYAVCSTDPDYGDLVTNWVAQMNGKA